MKKATILLAVLLLTAATLSAQDTKPASEPSVGKGATPVGATARVAPTGTSRAVVVGISDYRDAQIPDLRFADRDAEALVAWLRSEAGGSLPKSGWFLAG